MTLILIKTCISQEEEGAAMCTREVHNALDSGQSTALKDMLNQIMC